MSVENCKHFKKAVGILKKKQKMGKVTCDNPNCNLTFGYRKRYFGRDPKDGTPHPIQGWAYCGDVETRLEKIEKMLNKKGQFSVRGEMREKKIKEKDELEEIARELGMT